MWNRKLARALPALAVAVLLIAAPALAAPSTDAGAPARIVQRIADWWTGFWVSLFGAEAAPPTTQQATDAPTGDPESRQTIDPDG